MAAHSTGADWGFPSELPGGWVKVDGDGEAADAADARRAQAREETEREPHSASSNASSSEQPRAQRRTHYPPRQCRICLDVVLPTFHTDTASSLPASLQPPPRVTYDSPDSGRLLRPCKCKGSQKYVHEACLTAWRLQDPMRKRNYWECPTCRYRYRLQRLKWARWIGSTMSQIALTMAIFFFAMFLLGFVADPIINLYLDPVSTIASAGGSSGRYVLDDEPTTWVEHFIKGMASLGLLGFAKFLLGLSPWHWFQMHRSTGYGGGGRNGNTGRDRLNQISWIAVVVGIVTVLYGVWKGVRLWSRRTLERAGESVMDVPGAADDDED